MDQKLLFLTFVVVLTRIWLYIITLNLDNNMT